MTTEIFELDGYVMALLADVGIDTTELLRAAGLPPDVLSHNPVRLAAPNYFALWAAAAELTGDPALSVRVAERIAAKALSPTALAALCAADLNDAARRIQEFKPLISPLTFEVDQCPDHTEIRIDWQRVGEPPGPPAEFELLFLVSLARLGTRERITPLAVTGPQFGDVRAATAFLGVEPTAGPVHAVRFSAEDSARPFLTRNDRMWASVEATLRSRRAGHGLSSTITQRVQDVLTELLPSGEVSIETVSRELDMSGRTLQRRLQLEATSFRELLAATRQQLARRYLGEDVLSVAQIASLLGYDEPTSFQRAYRTWTGRTPHQDRSHLDH